MSFGIDWPRQLSLSLNTRLRAAFLAVALVPCVLLTVAAWSGAGYVAQQQEKLLRATAATTLDKIDRNLFERYGDAQAFASNPAVQDRSQWYLAGEEQSAIVRAANRYVALYGFYPLTMVVDTDGKVIAINTRDAAGKPLANASVVTRNGYASAGWFKAVLAGRYLNGPQGLTGTVVEDAAPDADAAGYAGVTGKLITYAAPVRNAEGQVIAVWRNLADFQLVEEILTSAQQELAAQGFSTAHLRLADREGHLLSELGKQATSSSSVLSQTAYASGALGYPGLGWRLKVSVAEAEALAFVADLRWRVLAGNAVALVFVLGMAWAIARLLSRPLLLAAGRLQQNSEQLQAAAGEIARLSGRLAGSATAQAAGIEQTSAAVAEITAIATGFADQTRAAHHRNESSQSTIDSALRQMESLGVSMRDMTEATTRVEAVIGKIEGIAFQTNILALNAAVEAARAGAAGLGFGVVADEVRRLAGTAAAAAQETAELLDRTRGAAQSSSTELALVSDSFRAIRNNGNTLSEAFAQVNAGAAEQAIGMHTIETALTELRHEAERTADAAQSSDDASRRILDCARESVEVCTTVGQLLHGLPSPA